MWYFKIYKNFDARILHLNKLSIDYFKQIELVRGIPWYVLDENKRLVGRIGLKEHREIIQKNKICINEEFIYVTEDGSAEQKCRDLFINNSNIKRIPVVSLEGKYLFEYERKQGKEEIEDFYREYKGCCYKGGERKEKIVVSLTSYGERLSIVHIAIRSILCQTIKPDKVVLYISEEDSKKQIEKEKELIKAGVIIKRHVKDLKPHKKYFYAMQEYSDSLIITIDDDCIYDDQTIENLYSYHLKFSEAVVCRRARRIGVLDGEIDTYTNWENYVINDIPESAVCPIGVGGILYPVGNYREYFLDEDGIRKTALYQDDLWLKVVEMIHGIKSISIDTAKTVSIDGSQKNALFEMNGKNQKNDICIQKLQKYFHINICDYL